jgi:Transposase IS116/IS110/IS902 family/Resolvase, N terminal domain
VPPHRGEGLRLGQVKNADRPELRPAWDYLRPGDTLVVPSPDRLSRSLADLIGRPRPRPARGLLERPGPGLDRLFGPARRLGAGNLRCPGGHRRPASGHRPARRPDPPARPYDPWVTVLTALPGVGQFTVLVLLAEIGDIRRFGSARKLVPRPGSRRWCAAVIVWSATA